MPSDTSPLFRSIRRWLMVIAFLLGIGVITLAHTAYVLTITRTTYVQSLVFSIAGVIAGAVAVIAGLKLLGDFSTTEIDDQSTT